MRATTRLRSRPAALLLAPIALLVATAATPLTLRDVEALAYSPAPATVLPAAAPVHG